MLIPVMASSVKVPSRNLNRLTVNCTPSKKLLSNSDQTGMFLVQEDALQNVVCKVEGILLWLQYIG